MSANSGPNARLTSLQGVQFLLELDPGIQQDIDQFKGRDHQLSLIWVAGGFAEIRVHDEYTPGGRRLIAGTAPAAAPAPPTVINVGGTMPAALGQSFPAPDYIFIDVHTGANTFDISPWVPSGVMLNQRVQIRKADEVPGRITYADPFIPHTYAFVDKIGEFITLLWTGTGWHII